MRRFRVELRERSLAVTLHYKLLLRYLETYAGNLCSNLG